MARELIVRLIGDDQSLRQSFLRSSRAGKQFEGSITGSLGKIRIGVGTLAKSFLVIEVLQKAMEGLSESVHLGTEEFAEHARVQAQTQAALKSTASAANVSSKQIESLGLSLSNLSGVDDELIQKGENLLLSFTNIRNFAGKNNDIFTQATKASVDLSVRSGRSVSASAVVIGRALQDPAKAAGSLRRAYIVLTTAEKSAIAAAVRHGDILKAQRLIIADVEKRDGGAARAAGQTLSGQLKVLKERFKDLAGAGIGLVAPALTRATSALTGFVVRLSEATSGRQKLRIAVSGVETVGRDLFTAIRRQIRSIDFNGIGAIIGARLRAINWRQQIEGVGQAIGAAVADNLQRLNQAIRNVNWNQVGQEIARGVGLAIGAAAVFLHSLNLGRVTKAVADVLGAALIAAAKLLVGVGEVIGKAVLKGIEAGLTAAERPIVEKADEIALKIIEPFTHLPFGIGGPAQKAKDALQQQLDDMAKVAASGAKKVSIALGPISKPIGSRNATAGFTPGPGDLPAPPVVTTEPKGLSASQKNTFFDNAISRILLRGGLGTIQQQIGALQHANALIAARISATKDVTRKLHLEDEILQNAFQIKGLQEQATQDALQASQDALQKRQDAVAEFIAGLQLRVTKAQATSTFKDDISAIKALQAGIRSEIKEFGNTADLAGQLFDAQQQLKQAKRAQITASEFRQLGLSATGDVVTPGVANLKKQVASIGDRISGTSLDTPKLRTELARFRKVLSEGLVPQDIRAKIRDMLNDIRDELKKGRGNLTKFSHLNSQAFVDSLGLNLTADQKRRIGAVFSTVSAGGAVPGVRSAAFAGGSQTTVVVHSTTTLDGKTVAKNTTKYQQKDKRRRAPSRRGQWAGRN